MAKILNLDTRIYNQLTKFILNGVSYKLHCYWNSRGGWYLSFYDPDLFESVEESTTTDKGLIVSGLKVMPDPDSNIISVSPDIGLPKGILRAVDTKPNLNSVGVDTRITVDNFGKGKRFQLFYITDQEIVNISGEG